MTESTPPKIPPVDDATTLHVARLARLKVSPEALKETTRELAGMLHLLQQLPPQEPFAEETQSGPSLSRRPDEPLSSTSTHLIGLSEGHQGDFVVVPPVLQS